MNTQIWFGPEVWYEICARASSHFSFAEGLDLLGLLGFDVAHHRPTLCPSVERIRRKGMRPFRSHQRISRIHPSLGPWGFDFAQHRPTPRPYIERICRQALFQISRIQRVSVQ